MPSFRLLLLALPVLLLAASPARAADDPASAAAPAADPADAALPTGFDWAGAPSMNYNPDHGVGFIVSGNVYWFDGRTEPYRDLLSFRFFLSSKLVNAHEVRWDSVEVAGLPLRVWTQVGLWSTPTQAFCGYGNAITCDPGVARAAAIAAGLPPGDAAHDTFVRRYYQVRYVSPYALVNARWRLEEFDLPLEVFGGVRAAYYRPGDWGDWSPYPGSLYAQRFPEGEGGLATVLQVGLMSDTRDVEAAPTRGWWVEASVRGSHPVWGSTWEFGGINTTLRGYVPLDRRRRLVAAARLVGDVAWGDLPVYELANVGGYVLYPAFGGHRMGRGVSEGLILGRLRVMGQGSLRWSFWHVELLKQRFDLGLAGFAEGAWVGADWDDLGGDPARVIPTLGGGLRVAWNTNFVLRIDLAASPFERWRPFVYAQFGNVF